MSRRAARIAAVEVLYGADVRNAETDVLLAEREDLDDYALHLVAEVRRRLPELDQIIGTHSLGWTPARMSSVDRNVLRVGVLELLERDVPKAAVIDEAVELAKRYSGEEAGRFVNGVLAAVMTSIYDPGAGGSGNGADGGGSGNGSEAGGSASGA